MRPRLIVVPLVSLAACSTSTPGEARRPNSPVMAQADLSRPVASVAGFIRPEAVRYDPDQDVYFVNSWGLGPSGAKDNNGFISRMAPDGTVQQLRFIAGGTAGVTLHAPRGMTVTGDTLWVVDADAVRAFNRRTGALLATVDFSEYKPGFLNDIAAGQDGLYVTDTGTNHIYRIAAGRISVALEDSALGRPNGITWDASARRFIVVPFGGEAVIRVWTAGSRTLSEIGRSSGAEFDGVELLAGGRVLVASQRDSSLHLFSGGTGRPIIRTGGKPADIGVDTRRNRVAVPFVARDLVEIWQLPPR